MYLVRDTEQYFQVFKFPVQYTLYLAGWLSLFFLLSSQIPNPWWAQRSRSTKETKSSAFGGVREKYFRFVLLAKLSGSYETPHCCGQLLAFIYEARMKQKTANSVSLLDSVISFCFSFAGYSVRHLMSLLFVERTNLTFRGSRYHPKHYDGLCTVVGG